jgi:hypothetical protein
MSALAESNGTATRGRRYAGQLHGVTDGRVSGWVWCPDAPGERVAVSVIIDGEIVAAGVAEHHRDDLVREEIGDGAHGFVVVLPPESCRAGRHQVLVLAGEDRVPLPATRSFWQNAEPGGHWAAVTFEPGGGLSAAVPEPPAKPSRRAVVGSGSWLFDAEELVPEPDAAPADVRAVVAHLRAVGETCAAAGIAYVPAIVPHKHQIIYKRAPAGAAQGRRWAPALRVALHDVDGVDLLDLRQVLRDMIPHGRAYNATDPDWNDRGAFIAARALLKEAGKRVEGLAPPPFADLVLRPAPGHLGELAGAEACALVNDALLPVSVPVRDEQIERIDGSRLQALRMPAEEHLTVAGEDGLVHARVYRCDAAPGQARVALAGDSAALAVLPWVAERAYRTVFFWGMPAMHQLELELPHVLLHLLRERDLPTLAQSPAP